MLYVVVADGNPDTRTDSAAAPSFSEQLSSLGSDSTSSHSTGTDSGVYQGACVEARHRVGIFMIV